MTPRADDELSRTLRELRRTAGLSSIAAAQTAGIGQAALSRYENGRFVPTPARLSALLDAYQAAPAVRTRLTSIVTDLRAENRRVVVHRRNAPAFQRRIRDIEAAATDVTTFQPTIVPGLLQTEAYMRALTTGIDPTIADGVIAARRERQALLGTPGRHYTQILTAGALLWCADSPAVMTEQLDAVIAASWLDGVRIGVIRPRTPTTVFPLHGFDLYDHRAVIVGTLATTAIITDPDDVTRHLDLLAALEPLTRYDDEAREIITEIRDGYTAF